MKLQTKRVTLDDTLTPRIENFNGGRYLLRIYEENCAPRDIPFNDFSELETTNLRLSSKVAFGAAIFRYSSQKGFTGFRGVYPIREHFESKLAIAQQKYCRQNVNI